MSTYGTGMGSGSPMSRPGLGATPPKKPAPSKKSKKKGFTGDMQFSDLLTNKYVHMVLGAIAVIGLGYVVYLYLPEGTGKLIEAHKQFSAIYTEVEKKTAEPQGKDWDKWVKSTKEKADKISLTIGSSSHPAKTLLSGAKQSILAATKAKNAKELEKKLEDAKKKLDDAKKNLGMK